MKKDRLSSYITTAATWLVSAVLAIPFLWMILLSFKTDSEIALDPFSVPETFMPDNYIRAIKTLDFLTMYKNTLIIAALTLVIGIVFPFMSSYAITRLQFQSKTIKNGIYNFLMMGQMIPVYILLFPIYRMNINFGLSGRYLSIVLPLVATNIAFNTLMFVGFLRDFPSEMEEAAIIDGCNLGMLCTRVVIPIMKPVMTTTVIFNILYIWNEYPLTVTMIKKPAMYTISLAASMFKGQYSTDISALVAGTILIIIPQLFFYILFQRQIIGGMTAGAIKG